MDTSTRIYAANVTHHERKQSGKCLIIKTAKQSEGFTLLELVIVVTIIGILAAIVIPNYLRFAGRAKDALVRENMHVVQTGIEEFSVERLGAYPQPADHPALQALMPQGAFPRNPFTNNPTPIAWNADPATPGDISIFNLPGGGYMVKGYGKDRLLDPPIVVGK